MEIELKQISKYYQVSGKEKRMVLDDLSLKIESGDSIAIVGPSGSGKSTLLNLISSLDHANSGVIFHGEREIGKLAEDKIAQFRNRNLGFIFQSHHLLPQLSLIENVLVPLIPEKDKKLKVEAEQRAQELIDFVGLSGQISQLPGQMSGGECQRTAVVRALIHQPGLLLADEPTGSLDKQSADQLGDLLVSINEKQKVTLVVVTHSMDLAKKMKNIYKLDNGKLSKI
ncbi:ABC transporter ATP-binding protein [Marinifilum flexuosum]|uniref:Lipoprotein-releasing system ATP-binding protein n=1 Tax=Marinifilum flexuosum TaxID=1117708 RepID=A0A419WGD9_9BACT|nr:ABC transporter ATP-binding protein [Marinifilum flexuosum]RKD94549.1 lipoprotein-releasing system ATP-binding protein [Marinifilum flexuosum]